MLPLDNIRVVDLSARAPGPFCTMVLSDMGAQVLMVEAPPGADSRPPPEGAADPQREAAYNPLRRNKRSIVLDLKAPDARELFYRLAQDADVVVEGFRPGVVKRLGVDYETLKAQNPRLVYCSISGYGQTGPYRLLPGHDINYISFAGALGVIGSPDGTPAIPYNLVADFAAGGLLSAVSILTALWARERLGHGQYIDMAMTDGSLYLMAPVVGSYLSTGQVPEPGRMRLNGGGPDYQPYRCGDGKYLSVGSLEPRFWENLCTALGREDLVSARSTDAGKEAAIVALRELFLTRSRDEWFDLLSPKEIAVAKVYTVDEIPGDPQFQERGMLVEVPGPDGRPVPQVGVGPRLDATPGRIRHAGSPPGAQTREVLRELGLGEETISEMYRRGVVL